MNQRVEHLDDHDQPVVQGPVLRWAEPMRREIRLQVPDRLFGLTSGDLERSGAKPSLMFALVDGTDRRSWLACSGRRHISSMRTLTRSATRLAASSTSRSRCGISTSCGNGTRRSSPPSCNSNHRRSPALSALWHHAPSGIWRRSASGALWHFAPFGIQRRQAVRAVRQLPPYKNDSPSISPVARIPSAARVLANTSVVRRGARTGRRLHSSGTSMCSRWSAPCALRWGIGS